MGGSHGPSDDIGLDLIIERLGPALAGGARPRRIEMGSSPMPPKRKTTPFGVVSFLVDDIGLEPMTFRTSSGCSSQLS